MSLVSELLHKGRALNYRPRFKDHDIQSFRLLGVLHSKIPGLMTLVKHTKIFEARLRLLLSIETI